MGARVVFLCLLFAVNCLLCYKAVWGESGFMEYKKMRLEQRAAEEQCLKLDAENMALSREIRLLQTDAAYIEKMVRERLHYLHDNEILYLFGDDNDAAPETGEGPHERKN